MADEGWISTYALQNNVLSADTLGRQAMQDGYITAAKISDGVITVDKLDATLIKYLVEVANVDYAHVDYCRVG